MNQTSTAKKTNNALAEVFSLAEAKQGDGLSNVSTKDVMLPRIKLLQKMSPECDNASLPEAKAGQIFNSASQSVYDGPTGIRVVPCEYIRTYVEWAPEGTGNKAPVNIHPATSNVMSLAKKSPTDNRFYLDNGNYVEETANHFVLVLDGNGYEQALITMKSTQRKVSRKWNSMMKSLTMQGKNGSFTPPSYSHVYRLKTVPQSNAKGTWFGWDVFKVGPVQDANVYETAKLFALGVSKNSVKVEHQEEVNVTKKAEAF